MNYVLFIGSRVGYEALNLIAKGNCDILHVFIEKEHEHEHEKFYHSSIDKCKKYNVDFSVNSSQVEVEEILKEKQNNGNSINYIMSFGYRRMIPESVVAMANIAALGTHFSPLPRYRGFAPLNWVLINGEPETAVNLFYLDKEVDNGDIVDSLSVPINYEDDINTLFEKCLLAFSKLIKRVIPKLELGEFDVKKQDISLATYTCARNPDDGLIDWTLNSTKIYNLIRALTYPFPGAFTYANGNKIYIWTAEEYEIPKYEGHISGKVIQIIKDKGVVVLCGVGAILIKDVQLEGKERQSADQVIKSIRVTLG
jgi:methionyl-tRNA formyltransferase